jgi:subfamily B ATP-binding cassette protein MsbA
MTALPNISRWLSSRVFGPGPRSGVAEHGRAQILFRLLHEQTLRNWRAYLASLVLMVVLASCVTSTAYLIGAVVNATTLAGDFHSVLVVSAVIIAVFLVKGLAQYGQAILLTHAHARTNAFYRHTLFDRLLCENIDFLSREHSSETINRLRVSAEAPARLVDMMICAIGREGLSVIGLSAVMIYRDPLLSLGCMLSVPLLFLLARKSRARLDRITLMSIKAQSGVLEVLQETLHGMLSVKAFGLERLMRDRADREIASARDADEKIAELTWQFTPLIEALSGCVVALIIVYGSYRIISARAAPGDLVSYLTAFLLAYEPVKRLARFPLEIVNALPGLRMLYETLDSEPSEPSDDGKPDLEVRKGRIAFDSVTFGYRPDVPVLRGLSLVAAPGQATALVGRSGSGKSTIFRLLLRLYDCQAGTIMIDGQNIADVSRSSVRRHIAYLGQDAFLFHGTIAENITVGKLGASSDEIFAAARAANADEFIMSFPEGYETHVGENGCALSSGQRQRIAIARAFLKDSPIVLLDEPTASLDTISEREVRRAIAELCKHRTTLIIAHRMHTIIEAAVIYVVEGGEIREAGDHPTLLRNGPAYQALWSELQVQFEDG